MHRLLGAHLPAASPERRETVAGECLGCRTRFAIDVRLPLPAVCPDCGPTCSPARTLTTATPAPLRANADPLAALEQGVRCGGPRGSHGRGRTPIRCTLGSRAPD